MKRKKSLYPDFKKLKSVFYYSSWLYEYKNKIADSSPQFHPHPMLPHDTPHSKFLVIHITLLLKKK